MSLSILGSVAKGKQTRPPRLLVYGTPGIGKSTFAAGAPNPLFLDFEEGTGELDVARFSLRGVVDDSGSALLGDHEKDKWSAVLEILDALATEKHEYNTLVIDTVDWLESVIHENVCQVNGVDSIDKIGYSNGYKFALAYWKEIITKFERIRNLGVAIVLLAHEKCERFQDPERQAYDRYTPRLHKDATALLVEWCDALLFACRSVRLQVEDMGFNKKRTIAHTLGKDGSDRILRTVGSPACLAKNRYNLPEELPLNWQALQEAM